MNRTLRSLLAAGLVFVLSPLFASSADRVEKGNLVIEGIPEIPERIKQRMQQYQSIRSASLQDWLPSGEGVLISTRFGETSQIHRVDFPRGARHQITFFDEPVTGAEANPTHSGFLFGKDVGGSEFYQLFHFDLSTGEYTMLTDGESRNGGAKWANDGGRFAFYSTRRNGRDWDLYVADLNDPENPQRVLEEGGTWFVEDWSPEDQRLLVGKYVSINESYLYTLDLASGALTQINPSKEKISYGGVLWARDGQGVYFTSDEDSEFRKLRYYHLATGNITTLTEDIPWDISGFALSTDGRYLAYNVNEGGISRLHLRDLQADAEVELPEIPEGVVYGLHFSPDNEKLGLVLNTPKTPGDVYVLDISQNALQRWTYSEVGGLNTESFVSPTLIHYPTFDEVEGEPRRIPAFYYKPEGNGPFPAIVLIHGGPESQYRPYFRSTVQYYVNELGVAVLAPNVRGSAGYGKSYLKLDNWRKREDSVRDIGKLLDWIAEQPELDENRVAVMGGSYGGYMVLASMIHYNDRLRCGVEIVGISNFVTFLENTQDYRRDLRRAEYGDERNAEMREFLMNISPTTNAHKITKPMFIAQGLNDPRVPASESEQIVEAIRENEGTVWYLLAKDEGHGFRKKSNRDYYENAVALFFERFLVGDGMTQK